MNKTLVLSVLCVWVLCLGMYSCKSTVATSDLNLVNGKIDTTNKFPAVLQITTYYQNGEEHICVASVISHNTLLTTANCLYRRKSKQGATRVVVNLEGKEVEAKTSYVTKNYKSQENGDEWVKYYAEAVIIFEDHTFDGITPLKIYNQKVKKNDDIIYVGYGLENEDQDERTWGYNTVTQIEGDNVFVTSTPLDAMGSPGLFVEFDNFGGDKGGAVLSRDNPNLIIGMMVANSSNMWGVHTVGVVFDKVAISWFKKINETTDAVIPLDGIK